MGKFAAFLMIGLVLIGLGTANIRGNISSIHWYNRRKVVENDVPKYGKCIGTGTVIMGGSMIISAILEAIFRKAFFDFFVLIGCVLGLTVILYGQFKYNKGIFD